MILKKIKYIFSVNLKPYLFGFLIGIEFGDLNQLKTAGGVLFFLWANQKRMH
jgi:hypothetical protein